MLVSAIRTIIIYIAIVAAIRVMGKRQIGELRPSELVVTLLIADLAAVPMQETGTPLLHGLIPMLMLVALELLTSAVMLKAARFERLVSGNPIPLIRNGVVDVTALKKLRLTMDDLMEAMRKQNCFDITEVDCALAETSGTITLYLRPAYRPATCADVQAVGADDGMPALVLTDGNFCPWGLQVCQKSEQSVNAFLIRKGLAIKQVFMMTLSRGGRFCILTVDGTILRGEEAF